MTIDVINPLHDIQSGMTFLADLQMGQGIAHEMADAIWFIDPYWAVRNEHFEEDHVDMCAMNICRNVFPHLYIKGLQLIQQGISLPEFDRAMTHFIEWELETDVSELFNLMWGIPNLSLAITEEFRLDDIVEVSLADIKDNRLRRFISWIGVEMLDSYTGPFHQADKEKYERLRGLFQHLIAHDDPDICRLGWLVGWCFSITNNTYVDNSYIQMSEWNVDLLQWNDYDYDFFCGMRDEAQEIRADADAGLAWLWSDARLRKSIQTNIERVIHHDTQPDRVFWRSSPPSIRTIPTASGAVLLRPRDHSQQENPGRWHNRVRRKSRNRRTTVSHKGRLQHRTAQPKHTVRQAGRHQSHHHRVSQTADHSHLARWYEKRTAGTVTGTHHEARDKRGRNTGLHYIRRQRSPHITRRQTLSRTAA